MEDDKPFVMTSELAYLACACGLFWLVVSCLVLWWLKVFA